MVDKAKEAYFEKMIEDKKDTTTLWRAINTFTKKSKNKNCNPTNISPDDFNQHFLSVSDIMLSSNQRKASENFICPEKKLIDFCKDKETSNTFTVPLLTVYEVGVFLLNTCTCFFGMK